MVENNASLAKTMGKFDEAIGLFRKALEVDPLSADNYYNLALTLDHAGRPDEAVAALKRVLALEPAYASAHLMIARVYLGQSRAEEAMAEARQEKDFIWHLVGMPLVYHAMGQKKEADAALTELIAKLGADAAFQIAEVYGYRGESDLAFQWLERAYSQRDGGLTEIKGDPLLKGIEKDPRYAPFLRKIRL